MAIGGEEHLDLAELGEQAYVYVGDNAGKAGAGNGGGDVGGASDGRPRSHSVLAALLQSIGFGNSANTEAAARLLQKHEEEAGVARNGRLN
jgi:hypothetical protein